MKEIRERYQFVPKYTSILDSPDSCNALQLSGVSTDPNILISTIPSPLESSPALENFIKIETNRIEEKEWDSLDDYINID